MENSNSQLLESFSYKYIADTSVDESRGVLKKDKDKTHDTKTNSKDVDSPIELNEDMSRVFEINVLDSDEESDVGLELSYGGLVNADINDDLKSWEDVQAKTDTKTNNKPEQETLKKEREGSIDTSSNADRNSNDFEIEEREFFDKKHNDSKQDPIKNKSKTQPLKKSLPKFPKPKHTKQEREYKNESIDIDIDKEDMGPTDVGIGEDEYLDENTFIDSVESLVDKTKFDFEIDKNENVEKSDEKEVKVSEFDKNKESDSTKNTDSFFESFGMDEEFDFIDKKETPGPQTSGSEDGVLKNMEKKAKPTTIKNKSVENETTSKTSDIGANNIKLPKKEVKSDFAERGQKTKEPLLKDLQSKNLDGASSEENKKLDKGGNEKNIKKTQTTKSKSVEHKQVVKKPDDIVTNDSVVDDVVKSKKDEQLSQKKPLAKKRKLETRKQESKSEVEIEIEDSKSELLKNKEYFFKKLLSEEFEKMSPRKEYISDTTSDNGWENSLEPEKEKPIIKKINEVVVDDIINRAQINYHEYSYYIFSAIADRNLGAVDSILQVLKDTEIRNKMGDTPLLFATRVGDRAIINYLISNNANKSARGSDGLRAIDIANEKKMLDLQDLLEPQ